MKKHWVLFSVIVLIAFTAVGLAKPGKNGKLKIKPYVVDPDKTGATLSSWMPHQGLSDSGKSYHALYFQKDDLSAASGYAYAKVKPFTDKPAAELTELGFDFRNAGHCTLNAPRFEVEVDNVVYSVGCMSGVATASPDDPLNWTRVRFTVTELSAAGVPAIGTIQSLKLVFDEGTDAGPGYIYLDNVDVNSLLIRKSGNGGPKN